MVLFSTKPVTPWTVREEVLVSRGMGSPRQRSVTWHSRGVRSERRPWSPDLSRRSNSTGSRRVKWKLIVNKSWIDRGPGYRCPSYLFASLCPADGPRVPLSNNDGPTFTLPSPFIFTTLSGPAPTSPVRRSPLLCTLRPSSTSLLPQGPSEVGVGS